MSISGAFLVVITASFLKPLLSTNQSVQLPTVAAYDQYSNDSPFEEADDGDPNVFLTLRLPQLLTNIKDTNLESKRQFDPWGGKRHSKSLVKDENVVSKRQFSPWGGKRSMKNFQFPEDLIDGDAQLTELYFSGNKKTPYPWGSKRGFNSWGGKRGFNSWGGKRNSNPKNEKYFNSWGGKRNFNAWGGKRSPNVIDKNFNELSSVPNMNADIGSKRQTFNSWGGKRGFNSWGGKRGFSSWEGKQAIESEDTKDVTISENNALPQTYNSITEGS